MQEGEGIVHFEEAFRKSGFGKFNYLLITLAGGLLSCAFIELTSINFVLSVAECDLGLTSKNKGVLSAIGYIGVILSSHIWGFLADTKGRRMMLIFSLLIAFSATVVSSLANNFLFIVFLRFIHGIL